MENGKRKNAFKQACLNSFHKQVTSLRESKNRKAVLPSIALSYSSCYWHFAAVLMLNLNTVKH